MSDAGVHGGPDGMGRTGERTVILVAQVRRIRRSRRPGTPDVSAVEVRARLAAHGLPLIRRVIAGRAANETECDGDRRGEASLT